jgi:DNA-binding MarR family transcriptional regulator
MIDEVKYLEAVCTETLSSTGHDAESSCPPVECATGHHAGEMSTSEEVHLYLLAIGERLRQHVAEVSHRYDLTPQQALVMDRLVERHSMGQLADDLACDPSNVTGLIRRLEQRGLVARVADESDRRTKWLSLTPAGVELRDAFRREIFQGSDVLTGMGEGEQKQLLEALRVIVGNLGARSPGD